MSHSHSAGLLAAYNSLTDKHLAGYFNNARMRRHLLRSGLISRNGRILSEKEYKLNIMSQDHQKYIRECLAQAIFHKVLDMERYHQLEIKKKLETLARKERIPRFKTAPRPYTAPGNMQPPIRLQPLPRSPAVGTVPKITSGSRSKTSLLENNAPFPIGGKKAVRKFRNFMDNSQGMNQHQLLNITSHLKPIPPPPPPPRGRGAGENRPEPWRRRRFRPITAPNGLEPLFTRDLRRIPKTPLHSNAAITMIYLGKNVHLSYDHTDFRDEIKVYQQHCGGENLCVYKGKLLEKETFQFISKRHHGFPFSLTFFLNGMQVNRLSSCCEYKHRKGSRLGGKRGYFGLVCVERSSPCYKCIIAMGLDKKLASPKLKKEKSIEKREELKKGEGKLRKTRKHIILKQNDLEGSKASASVMFSAQEENTGVEEVRTAVEEMERTGQPRLDVWEDDHQNMLKYEYEEDFEVDEEKQDEKAHEQGQAGDHVNGMSKSPSDGEKDNLDPEKKSEILWQKASDADYNVKDEDDGRSDSESDEDEQDIKTASSVSSRSRSCSSCSEDESALGDRDVHSENSPDARSSSFQELNENDEPGKSHLPIKDSLETVIEDQKLVKADVDSKPLPKEESLENVLEEEIKKRSQTIAEGLSEKAREHVSEEEKEKDKSKLWEGSAAKVKDGKAGPCRVETSAGQIIADAMEPGHHCHSGTESGVHSTDEEEKHSGTPEIDTDAAPNKNLVVKERAALNSNKESKQAALETYIPEKKEAVEEDEAPQHREADTMEEQGAAALRREAEGHHVPLRQGTPTAGLPAPVERFAKEREALPGPASRAEADAAGARGLHKAAVSPSGKAASGGSGGWDEDETPGELALLHSALQTEKAASEEERGSEAAALTGRAAALNSERAEAEAAPRAAVAAGKGEAEPGEAGRQAASERPGVEHSVEEASTDLEAMASVEDASKRQGGSGEAIRGAEEQAQEKEAATETPTPRRSSASVMAAAAPAGVLGDRLQGLSRGDGEGEGVQTEAGAPKEGDRKETAPEEFDAAAETRKSEGPEAPCRETESAGEAGPRAKALREESGSGAESKFRRGGDAALTEVRPEEEAEAPQKETVGEAADEAEGAADLAEAAGPPGDGAAAVLEAARGLEESLGNEGGEGRREAGAAAPKGRAERPGSREAAASAQDEGLGPEGEGAAAPGRAELATEAQDHGGRAGPGGRGKEEPLQGRQGVGGTVMTLEDVPEGDSVMAEQLSEEVMGKDPEREVEECTVGAGVTRTRLTEEDRSVQALVASDENIPQGEGEAERAAEEREASTDLKTAEGKTKPNKASSSSDVAGEETWHEVDELLGKEAAAEKAAEGEIALSREDVPAAEAVTLTGAPEAEAGALQEPSELEGKAPQLGQDGEGGAAEATLQAEALGEEGSTGSGDGGQRAGAAEEFSPEVSQKRESEPSRESPQDVETHPGGPDCTEIQEKQEQTVQRESENADVSPSNMEAEETSWHTIF
ncbi:glutamate-rich protein 3 isoform X2 [Manis javanica]|uniref:glutamate-rich protein 3 isoform X2 n=1 Tax=Manis javanica TaxID=9974 RepID=UPI003C6D4D5F